jgi:hypothetical protein
MFYKKKNFDPKLEKEIDLDLLIPHEKSINKFRQKIIKKEELFKKESYNHILSLISSLLTQLSLSKELRNISLINLKIAFIKDLVEENLNKTYSAEYNYYPNFHIPVIKFTIKQGEFAKKVREKGIFDALYSILKKPELKSLINKKVLEKNVIKKWELLTKLTNKKDILYRGIHNDNYIETFFKYGNSKTEENSSDDEKVTLKEYSVKPGEVIYASKLEKKARQAVRKDTTSYIVYYDASKFELLDNCFLYKIKKGMNFKDAIVLVEVIEYIN